MLMKNEFSFLSGEGLRSAIRHVMQGAEPRICVAFLGPKWVDELFRGYPPPKLRVICDLNMGATTKSALLEFGAPENERLRFLIGDQLHGKIYISQHGAIVCSANATYSGLSRKNRIEDGVFVPANGSVFDSIAEEFEHRYSKSSQVTQADMDKVPMYPPYSDGKFESLRSGLSLCNAILRNPSAFRDISFVFCKESVAKDVRDSAYSKYRKRNESVGALSSEGLDYFANWNVPRLEWPEFFINVYCTSRKIHLFKRNYIDYIESEEVFITRKIPWKMAGAAFRDCPVFGSKATSETELFDLIGRECVFEELNGKILSASDFAKFLSGRKYLK